MKADVCIWLLNLFDTPGVWESIDMAAYYTSLIPIEPPSITVEEEARRADTTTSMQSNRITQRNP
jgi:hypothetical protein